MTDSRASTIFSCANTGPFNQGSTICIRRAFSSRRVAQEIGRCCCVCSLICYSFCFTSALGPHTSMPSRERSSCGHWNKIFAIIPLSSCFNKVVDVETLLSGYRVHASKNVRDQRITDEGCGCQPDSLPDCVAAGFQLRPCLYPVSFFHRCRGPFSVTRHVAILRHPDSL